MPGTGYRAKVTKNFGVHHSNIIKKTTQLHPVRRIKKEHLGVHSYFGGYVGRLLFNRTVNIISGTFTRYAKYTRSNLRHHFEIPISESTHSLHGYILELCRHKTE